MWVAASGTIGKSASSPTTMSTGSTHMPKTRTTEEPQREKKRRATTEGQKTSSRCPGKIGGS